MLGLSPLTAALWSLPTTVAVAAAASTVGVLATSVRPGYLMAGGLLVSAAGLLVLTRVGAGSSLALVLTGATIMATGVVSAMTLTADMILASAPPEKAGAASALSETASEVGGALGVAILGSIGAVVYRHEIAGTLPAGLPPEAGATATDTLGGAAAVAAELPGDLGDALLGAARAAFADGLNVAAAAGAVTMVIAAVLAVVLLRGVRTAAAVTPPDAVEAAVVTPPSAPPDAVEAVANGEPEARTSASPAAASGRR